jgi:hypothetical protein
MVVLRRAYEEARDQWKQMRRAQGVGCGGGEPTAVACPATIESQTSSEGVCGGQPMETAEERAAWLAQLLKL